MSGCVICLFGKHSTVYTQMQQKKSHNITIFLLHAFTVEKKNLHVLQHIGLVVRDCLEPLWDINGIRVVVA